MANETVDVVIGKGEVEQAVVEAVSVPVAEREEMTGTKALVEFFKVALADGTPVTPLTRRELMDTKLSDPVGYEFLGRQAAELLGAIYVEPATKSAAA